MFHTVCLVHQQIVQTYPKRISNTSQTFTHRQQSKLSAWCPKKNELGTVARIGRKSRGYLRLASDMFGTCLGNVYVYVQYVEHDMLLETYLNVHCQPSEFIIERTFGEYILDVYFVELVGNGWDIWQ